MALGCSDAAIGAEKPVRFFDDLGLEVPDASEDQYEELKILVNSIRLKNHPIKLDLDIINKDNEINNWR